MKAGAECVAHPTTGSDRPPTPFSQRVGCRMTTRYPCTAGSTFTYEVTPATREMVAIGKVRFVRGLLEEPLRNQAPLLVVVAPDHHARVREE